MSNSNSILYSAGKNDECYTPEYGVKPIIKYIPKNWVVWCPFDKEDSQFVKLIKENGNKVIYSHIDNGQDFCHRHILSKYLMNFNLNVSELGDVY